MLEGGVSLRGREGLGRGINRRWQGKCCPFNALYIMNKISPMHLLIESVKAHDKAKALTHPHGLPPFPPHLLDGLIHLLERVEAAADPLSPQAAQRKGGLKFYARTAYLALAIRCGDSIASSDMVSAIEESSYYLAHKCYLQSSDFIQFLSSTEVSSKASYFLSQQHQQLESALWLMLGPEGKVSTPFDFADAISGHLTLSSFGGLLECLIDFALTVPETAQLSSEEIFVGCCLLAAEKANSQSLSALLEGSFGGAMGKGGQLSELMKELFMTISPEL